MDGKKWYCMDCENFETESYGRNGAVYGKCRKRDANRPWKNTPINRYGKGKPCKKFVLKDQNDAMAADGNGVDVGAVISRINDRLETLRGGCTSEPSTANAKRKERISELEDLKRWIEEGN
jgi:hypothetical protein